MVGVGLGQIRLWGHLEGPLAGMESVETAFNEHRLELARRRRSYRPNDHSITQI